MHCPRCGTNAAADQQFCRACGLSLEKVAELVGEDLAIYSSSSNTEVARLRERQRKLANWGGIASLVTFGLILLTMIVVIGGKMLAEGRPMLIPGLLMILLFIAAGAAGILQTYSKSLKQELPASAPPRPQNSQTKELDPFREPVPTVTDRTTELLPVAKAAKTRELDD